MMIRISNKPLATGALLTAFGLISMSASAGTIPDVSYGATPTFAGAYDPLLTDNNTLSHGICSVPTTGGASDCASIDPSVSFTDIWTLQILNDGILTLNGSAVSLSPLGQFDVFTAVLKDKNGTQVASFPPLMPNPVGIFVAGSNYTFEVTWSITQALVDSPTGSGRYSFDVTTAPGSVPEPGSLALLGLGLVGMGLARRKA